MKFFKKLLFTLTLGLITVGGAFAINNQKADAAINMNPAYDLSEWQHQFNDNQVQQLKNESSFVILRAQYGGNYADRTFANNAALMEKYGIPYGVYSYSLYANSAQAQEEAQQLYTRAPNARFYANDLEQANGLNNNDLNNATITWSNTMKSISNRPVVLYSGQYFMNRNISDATRSNYDAIWLANYSQYEPNPSYQYDLWQFTSRYNSNALGQNVDASVIPDGAKPLSFWTGSDVNNVTNNTNTTTDYQNNNQNNSNNQSNQMTFPPAPSAPSNNDNNSSDNNTNNGDNNNNTDNSNNNNPQPEKPKVNTKTYYSSKKVKELKVKSRGGINIYSQNGHKIGHAKYGTVLKVDRYQQIGTITKAVSPYGSTFTANKTLVKWAR